MWMWIILVISITLAIRFTYTYQSGRCTSTARLTGKTVIITGASAGIGKATALDLARRGARVIMACRNIKKGQKVADLIIERTGNPDVIVRELELSSLSSVRRFANQIILTESALHVLINNAGIAGCSKRKLTEDNLELTMATNYFGHFLLTHLLLGLLKASSPSRVINVSSDAHKLTSSLDPDDLNYERNPYPSGDGPYSKTKLANILFNIELARKLQGSGITANCVHPGVVYTEILTNGDFKFFTPLLMILFPIFAKDEELGAQTIIHLAVSDEVANVSGEYFTDCKVSNTTSLAKDQNLSKRLWEKTEALVKLTPSERHY